MEDLPDIVALNIRRLRHERGLSQETLAFRAKIDRSYLGTIERAESSITVVTLGKVARGLEVLPSALLQLPEDHPYVAALAEPGEAWGD